MPANLTPQYKKVEEQYRAATTDEERLALLEEMLRVIPKHKGTEGIRADLKRKISRLKTDFHKKSSSGKHIDIFHVPKTGAGQVVLIGLPNSGKSSILAALSKAKVTVADYPFATQAPVPGVVKHEDVPIELVDMPPITADYAPPAQAGTYRHCDLVGIVIDLADDVLEQMQTCIDYLESKKLLGGEEEKPTMVICTKADIGDRSAVEAMEELYGGRFEYLSISPETGEGMEEFTAALFRKLDIIRIYAKPPGKPADMGAPFTLKRGQSVHDLAVQIHRQLAEKLKSARVWGTGVYDGQNVSHDHVLHDKDIVELHFG